MPVTIKDIAALAGVSRGTVDRALHDRGRVDPEVKERVLAIARQMGYKPSRAARQLAVQKRHLKLGIICRNDVQGFWSEVAIGVDEIAEELAAYDITVLRRYFDAFQLEEQLVLIDELVEEGIAGLVIVPLNHESIREKLQALMDAGITVVVINSEIEGFTPYCYIGNDYFKSGRTAAGLMHQFSGGRHLNLAVLQGAQYMMSHRQRMEGFMGELDELGTRYTLLGGFEITSDAAYAYEHTVELLRERPETDAVFTAAGSVISVCQAIRDLGLIGKVIHISYDLTPTTRPKLLEGSINAVIGQEAYRQGYLSLKILFDSVACGLEPESRRILTHNEIFIRQNCQ